MTFSISVTPSGQSLRLVLFCLLTTDTLVLSMTVRANQTAYKSYFQPPKSLESIVNKNEKADSRQFGGETNHFQNWKVWDRPDDQLAIESMNLGGSGNSHYNGNYHRTKKLLRNNTIPLAEVIYVQEPNSVAKSNSGDNGVQRNDCNSANLQVSFLPVILAIIAVVAGIIGIIVLWFIAKAFVSTGGHGGYSGGSGWSSNKNFDPAAFSRNLKNFDMEQLTNLVMKGVESYKKAFEVKDTA